MPKFTEDQAKAASLAYFHGSESSANIFVKKYALRDNDKNLLELTPDDEHWRIAKEFARIEAKKFKKPLTAEEIYEYLKGYDRIMVQGSPAYGIGNKFQFTTLSNCYVLDTPLDSYGGIHHTDEQLSQIAKRRGGAGLDLSDLRPALSPTHNASRTSTGIVTFAERYSNSTREVGQDGRRGALMLTLSVKHPQILDFARMKLEEGKIEGANVSIRLTDAFMRAATSKEKFELQWPVYSESPEISKLVDANEIWMEIIRCAHMRAEPGLLFWDRIIRESPADCYSIFGFQTVSTNPCSELPLSVLDSCRLMVQVLFGYVVNPFTSEAYFSFSRFEADAKILQRLMDDLVDLEIECIDRIIRKIKKDPEPDHIKSRELDMWIRIRESCENGRRTGSGITALGDTLAALGIKYGTEESIEMTRKIYRSLKLSCYRSSVEMAKELGPFKVWDHNLEKNNPFLLRIKDEDPKLWDDMRKYGRRNISLLTTAPVGTRSFMSGPQKYCQSTSGIEPLFAVSQVRWVKINMDDPGARCDRVDDLGDKWQRYEIFHSKVKMWMDISGEVDITKSPYYGATANDIDWVQRVKLQAAAQEHVDHAISSTINLPSDVSVEKVAEIYETAWRAGCKGITVYRDGCRQGVIHDANKKEVLAHHDAEKRPKELPCEILVTTVKGLSHYVLIGILDNKPYEVFAGENCTLSLDKRSRHGVITRKGRGAYLLKQNEHEPVEISGNLVNDDHEAVTRLVSALLRHNVPINYIVHQLEKVEGDMFSISKAIARGLKKHIKDGEKVTGEECASCGAGLVRQEGCVFCPSCGWSRC